MFAGGLRESREDSVRLLGVDQEALEVSKTHYSYQSPVVKTNLIVLGKCVANCQK